LRREVTVERKAISIAQACQSVGVSRRTIYNWMAAGKVEYVRTAGGAVRIFEDTLWRTPQSPTVGAVSYRTTDTAADRGRL
jgi:excisionase family DNA binding protein